MYSSYGDKQPTNDNAMQRHTYSRVPRRLNFFACTYRYPYKVLSSHNSPPLLLGSRLYAYRPAFQLNIMQGSFDGMMKVLLFIIHSPLYMSLVLRCTNIHFLTSLLVPPGFHFLQRGLPTSARSAFNVYASYPVLQRLLPWCLSCGVFFHGVLWQYGVPHGVVAASGLSPSSV